MIKALLKAKSENKTIGFVASTFDLLHSGHDLMLYEAKLHCDILLVGLQSDPTIDRKEKNKPVQELFERYVQISSNENVDYVVPYSNEEDLLNLLNSFPIDIRFLDEEYMKKDFTGSELDIKVHFNERRHSFSSSGLRVRVKEAEDNKDG